jgi:hypothetical protein
VCFIILKHTGKSLPVFPISSISGIIAAEIRGLNNDN